MNIELCLIKLFVFLWNEYFLCELYEHLPLLTDCPYLSDECKGCLLIIIYCVVLVVLIPHYRGGVDGDSEVVAALETLVRMDVYQGDEYTVSAHVFFQGFD